MCVFKVYSVRKQDVCRGSWHVFLVCVKLHKIGLLKTIIFL